MTAYSARWSASQEQIADWVERFNRDGCLFREEVLPLDWMAELRADLDRALRENDEEGNGVIQLHHRMFEISQANLRLFDMEPIRLSFLNKTLRMSREEALRNSPLAQTYPQAAPLSLVLAADESPEYHRQSQAMEEHWQKLGYPAALLVPRGLNHFDVVNQLRDPTCELVRVQLAEMKKAFGQLP